MTAQGVPKMQFRKGFVTAGLVVAGTLLFLSAPVHAAPQGALIQVTTGSDENGSGPLTCSRREAITAANKDTAFGGCPKGDGDDTIQLGIGTYYLDLHVAVEDDTNQKGDFDILENVTIQGKSQDYTIVDGSDDRLFDIHD